MRVAVGWRRIGRWTRWAGGLAMLALLIAIGVAPGSRPVAASGVTVKMLTGNTFSPADISVVQGTTVTWVDDDRVEPIHNIEEADGAFGTSGLAYDQTYSFTFGANTPPGVYSYQCTIHYGMTGTVTVLPSLSTATPNPQPLLHATVPPLPMERLTPPTHVVDPITVGSVRVQPGRH